MPNKIPRSPFTMCLSGSAKETELRLRNIFQWKKQRPPLVLFLLTAALVLSCCGLVSCRVEPAEQPNNSDVTVTPSGENLQQNANPSPDSGGSPLSTDGFFASYVTDFPGYAYDGSTTTETSGHVFTMEDTPNNLAEAALIHWKHLNWMDEPEKFGLVSGNEALKLAASSSYKSYTIHEISTLTPEEFTVENMPFLNSFLRDLSEDVEKFALAEYTVVYVNHSWEWIPEHLALGPQLGNGRYEWLYLLGKTEADDAWKVYELYWGEGVFNRILNEDEPVSTVWQGETITFPDGNLTITLPESWKGKAAYQITQDEVSFYLLSTSIETGYEGAGHLCTVKYLPGEFYPLNYSFPWPGETIAMTSNGSYVYWTPSDVQFTPATEEEYTALFSQVHEIQFVLSDDLKANSLNKDNPDHPDFTPVTLNGRTMAVMQDTVLTGCYSYHRSYTDPDNPAAFLWFTVGEGYTLTAGDIVLVLDEADGMSRVVIPYGDVPWLYGFVDSTLLSADKPDIFAAVGHVNQAIIAYEIASYSAPGGTGPSDTLYPCRVETLEVQNGWAKVQPLGTGADACWVDSSHLYYGFADDPVIDAPPGINLVS